MNLNKKNILILGVGNAQVDAIKVCKESGYNVFAISYHDEGPGKKFVDKFDVINITNKKEILNYVYKNMIDFVYSVGSDIAMPTIGYVSSKSGKPMLVSCKTAELLQNKAMLRNFLSKNNLCSIPFKILSEISNEINWNLFPAIIKPVDSQGQRGVYKVISFEEIKKYFSKTLKHSRCKKVILEKYIDGMEISVNSFVYNGKIIYNFISDRLVVNDAPGGIACGHRLPSQAPKLIQKKADKLTKEIISKLNIKNGPVYFQLKYNSNDVFVIEVAPRLDGCHIWRLIKLKYGIDFMNLTFNILSNKLNVSNHNFSVPETQYDGSLRLEFFLQKPGTLVKIKTEKLENLLYKEWYYSNDEIVKPINGYLEKTGYQILLEN